MSARVWIELIHQMKYGGQYHKPGKRLEVDEATADEVVPKYARLIEPPAEPEPPAEDSPAAPEGDRAEPQDPAPPTDDQIIKAVWDVAEAGNPDDLTADGRPKVDAVSKALGRQVTGEQVVRAWGQVKEQIAPAPDDSEE